jgi:uncharacterized membrane protein YbjE (DUF340 family)
MLIIIGCFIAGIVLGRLLRSRQQVIKIADRFTMWAVFLLLFVLGVSVGVNQQVLANVGSLGLQAGVLSLGAIVGSIVAVQLLNLWPVRDRR